MALSITRILRFFGITNTVGVRTLQEAVIKGSTAKAAKGFVSSFERQPNADVFGRG